MLVCGNVGNVYTTGRYTRGCAHKTVFESSYIPMMA